MIVGNSGGEFGVRGWITALDANSGKIAWRAYNTGPDAECLIGPNFKPFYDHDKGKDLGISSWPPDQWKIGGGTSIWPVMLLTLPLASGGTFISWRNWRRAGGELMSSGGDTTSVDRFMAIVGMVFSGFSLLVIIAMWLPTIFYRQCQR